MSTSARPASTQTPEKSSLPTTQKDDDQKAFEALITSINKLGKSGLQTIETFKLPSSAEHKAETPLFSEENSFLFNESRRMAIAGQAYEHWPAMQKFHKLFLKKAAAKTQKDIDEIKKLEKEIVETHLISLRELESYRELRNKKTAHRTQIALKKTFYEKALGGGPRLKLLPQSVIPRSSTSSRASNSSNSSTVDADTFPANNLEKARDSKASVEPPSPSYNSRNGSRSASTSQTPSMHRHIFTQENQFPQTPTGRVEPSYNLRDLVSAQKGTVKIYIGPDLYSDIVESYLSDTLITSDFETKVMAHCRVDLEQFFTRLTCNQPTDIAVLHKAEQRSQEYKSVYNALRQFIEANKNNTHHGMRSAVKYACLMQTELWQLKFVYEGMTRLYPEWREEYLRVKNDPAHEDYGSERQEQAQKKENELDTLLKAAKQAFSQFDKSFQKLCFETTNKLNKIYHRDPFVSLDTITQIKNLTDLFKNCLPPPKEHGITATVPQKQKKSTTLLSRMFTHSKAPPARQNKGGSSKSLSRAIDTRSP